MFLFSPFAPPAPVPFFGLDHTLPLSVHTTAATAADTLSRCGVRSKSQYLIYISSKRKRTFRLPEQPRIILSLSLSHSQQLSDRLLFVLRTPPPTLFPIVNAPAPRSLLRPPSIYCNARAHTNTQTHTHTGARNEHTLCGYQETWGCLRGRRGSTKYDENDIQPDRNHNLLPTVYTQ